MAVEHIENRRLNTVSALDRIRLTSSTCAGQYGDENFLVAGLDSRLGDNANMAPATPTTPAARDRTP